MRAICRCDELLQAFRAIELLEPRRTKKRREWPVRITVADDRLSLTAEDEGGDLRVSVAVANCTALEPGGVIILGDDFRRLLITSEESLSFEGTPSLLRMSEVGVNVGLATLAFAEDDSAKPRPVVFPPFAFHQMQAHDLKLAIDRTIFAADLESSRYALGGVLLCAEAGDLCAVATDGRRLACQCVPVEWSADAGSWESVIAPLAGLRLLQGLLADFTGMIEFSCSDNLLAVNVGTINVSMRCLEGRFPKWKDILPAANNAPKAVAKITVAPFLRALRSAAVFTDNDLDVLAVAFQFESGRLALHSALCERGHCDIEVAIEYSGSPAGILLRPVPLIEFLEQVPPAEQIVLELRGHESVVVCRGPQDYQYLTMPVSG